MKLANVKVKELSTQEMGIVKGGGGIAGAIWNKAKEYGPKFLKGIATGLGILTAQQVGEAILNRVKGGQN